MRSRLSALILFVSVALFAVWIGILSWYGFRVSTELRPGSWREPTEIADRNGATFLKVYGPEWHVTDPLRLEDLPDHVRHAFVAAEDVRFSRHPGVDPIGIARAAMRNVRAGGIAEGGSTITQQLARMRFLTQERTVRRKVLEVVVALVIEVRLSKDEILEAYLNDVYLGHRNGRGILGLDEASRAYFNKPPAKLTAAEASSLAAMIRAPNAKVVRQRRDAVLEVMRDRGWISEDEHDKAVDASVRFRRGSLRATPHPYLVAAVRSELVDRVGERRLRGGGLKIATAIDPQMQRAAEAAVRGGTQRLRGRYSWLRRKEPLQAAILSLDPDTGGIRALVGGSDFRKSQFDRTRRMRRQAGSAMKPFAYATALDGKTITAASIVEDKEVEIRLARNDIWRPQNYDAQFRGQVTVREAFEKSLNTPAVRIADEIGVRRVRDVLDDAGIEGELSDTPALALGVDEVSMRELAGAYSVFPNLGRRSEPHLIESIQSASGRTIHRFKQKEKKVLEPAVAYLVHSLMRGVVQRGTASDLGRLGLGHIAGKTGTTNDYRDAWFVGYGEDLLTASWVGFDDGTPLRISSAEAALPIWAAYMTRARHSRAELNVPAGVEVAAIEPASGLLWRPGCGMRFEEVFLAGTAPTESCQRTIERPPIMIDFQEPPVISPDESSERSEEMPDLGDVQIIIDPAAGLPPEEDDDPDELNEEERQQIDQQMQEALRVLEQLRRGERPKELEKAIRELEKQQRKDEKKRDD